MVGNAFATGLGTVKFQPGNEPLQTCEEMLIPGCAGTESIYATSPTDGCCKVGPCEFCLFWKVYGKETETGIAKWDGEKWIGTVDGIEVVIYIAIRDVCTLFVELDGIIAYSAALCTYGNTETCTNLDGEVGYTKDPGGYGEESGIICWEKKIVHELQRRMGDPPGDPCDIDVCLILDATISHDPAIEDLQGNALQPLVDYLGSLDGSYRMSLITFKKSVDETELNVDFDLNNGVSFLAGIEAIVTAENGGPVTNDRRTDAAFNIAANTISWRDTAEKICIVVTQGDANDPANGETSLIAFVTQMKNAAITTHAITTGYWTDPGPTHEYNAETTLLNFVVAEAGGGTNQLIKTDGDGDFNGGVVALPDAITDLVNVLCPPPPERFRCARPYCGACNCTCDNLCITVTNLTSGGSCTGVLPQVGERCGDKLSLPRWMDTIDCTATGSILADLFLQRNQYDDTCELEGTIDGTIEDNDISLTLPPMTVTECDDLNVTWQIVHNYDTYNVTVSCLECGKCEAGRQTPCCIAPLPSTLYAKIVNDINSECIEAAGIIELNWELEDHTGSGQFGFGNGGGWVGSASLPCAEDGVACVKFWCAIVSTTGKPTNDDCLGFAAQVNTGCGLLTPDCETLFTPGNGNAGNTTIPGCECTDPDEQLEQLYVIFSAALSDPGCAGNPIAGYHLEVAENPDDLP